MGQITEQFVDSSDGVRIAVYEEGNPNGPTVVLVHGWPDSHVLWDGVVPLLADRFRIVRYDNRGVGKSSVPKPVSAYTMARYADDFAAVIDELRARRAGACAGPRLGIGGVWEYLSRPGASDRVASFTSVSGPSSGPAGRFIFRRPAGALAPRTFVRAIGQALRLTYMVFFSIPVLAPLFLSADAGGAGVATQRGRQHPRRADPPLRETGQ